MKWYQTGARWIAGIACALMGFAASGDSLFTRQVADSGTLISDLRERYQLGDIITVPPRFRQRPRRFA